MLRDCENHITLIEIISQSEKENTFVPDIQPLSTSVEISTDPSGDYPSLARVNGHDKAHGNQVIGHQASNHAV